MHYSQKNGPLKKCMSSENGFYPLPFRLFEVCMIEASLENSIVVKLSDESEITNNFVSMCVYQ